jgi:hypothetical protein
MAMCVIGVVGVAPCERTKTDDQELIADAWKLANDKARELGWIVRGAAEHAVNSVKNDTEGCIEPAWTDTDDKTRELS